MNRCRKNQADSNQQNFYSTQGGAIYIQSGDTNNKLTPASYSVELDKRSGEIYLRQQSIPTADDTMTTPILKEITGIVRSFYSGVTNNTFNNAGYKSKFGILLEGPAGTGKSQITSSAMNEFIGLGGVVITLSDRNTLVNHNAGNFFRKINTIQPDQPLMIIFEDIDRFTEGYEIFLTSILDGEQSPSNVIFFGTTNFEGVISDRIKRPGRFDFIYNVNEISKEIREAYIDKKILELGLKLDSKQLEEIRLCTESYNFSEIRTFMAYYGFFKFPARVISDRLNTRTKKGSSTASTEAYEFLDESDVAYIDIDLD